MADQKNFTFVRFLIVVLSGFILWIVAYSFLFSENKGTISNEIVILIILLIIIALSESFDNFSVGKIFTLSREIKDKENSINKISSENTQLRRELVKVVTSISQNQTSTNIIGLPIDFAKRMGVEKATADEISKKRNEESEESPERTRPVKKRINYQKLEELGFSKFLQKRNLSEYELIKEAKLVTQFSGIDAISNIHPIFDGYINTGESEIFIEIKASRLSATMMREKIYLLLNKIFLYNKIKNANAHLTLIILNIDSENNDQIKNQRYHDRFKEFFEPSIVSGLLKIFPIELTQDEISNIYSDS